MAKSNMNLKAFAGVVQSALQQGDAEISIDLIDVNPQVRTQFKPEKQASINASIAAQGINQSLVLHAKPNGRYDLIAGEYRYRGALANNLTKVPARVRHNLSPLEIRRIQVSENMERDDITAFDEARGVAADVETYGFEQAQVIWNRSEGWVSKRTAVLKYAAPVQKLLKDGVTNDLEVAHSLNQLHQLDEEEYARLEKSMRDGVSLSREEVRGKVKQVKEWKDEQKQRNDRRQALASTPAKETPSPRQAAAKAPAKAAAAPAPSREPAATAPADGGHPSASSASTTAGNSMTFGTGSSGDEQANQQAQTNDETGITTEQALVLDQMVTLFKNSVVNHGLMKDVQTELTELGADMNQTEWALWSLYQTIALPVLAALGETRAQRYLQRTIAELRTAKPQELWDKLHPAADPETSDDWTAARAQVAPMPKDWRF